jgi:predicted nucleic acid-binding protein
MPHYLTDSSIWIGARRNPGTYLPRLLVDRLTDDEIATCIPIALEVLAGPSSARELDQDWHAVWRHLRWLPMPESVTERALELLRSLGRTTDGAQRRRPVDYLVAACAETVPDVVVWHWDRDLVAICEHAGIAHEAEHGRARDAGIV